MPELAPIPDTYRNVGVGGFATGGEYTVVQAAAYAAAGTLVPGAFFSIGGVPYRATSATTYGAIDGEALVEADETFLIVGSSTEARANCMTAITESTISIRNNVVSFRTQLPYPLRAGHVVRVSALNTPQIECQVQVTSAVAESAGTRIIGTVMNGLVLPDTTASQVSLAGGVWMCDMQVFSSAAGYPMLLQNELGNRVRCIVLGTSGANPEDWLIDSRVKQIQQFGRVGAAMISPGLPSNGVNAAGFSADRVFAATKSLVEVLHKVAGVVYVCTTTVSTNEDNSTPKVAANTAVFAAAARFNALIGQLPKLYPYVRLVPVAGAEITNYGSVDTTDITNAYGAYRDKADDGKHNQWGACQNWALVMGLVAQPDFPFRVNEMPGKPFSVLNSAAADVSGKTIPNLAEGFIGNVPNTTTAGVPNSCFAFTNQLNGMTVTSAINVNADGGSDWVFTVNSNGNVGAANTQVSQIYVGTGGNVGGTAGTLLTQLNLPQNQGVPIDIIWQGGIYSFTELCMSFIECVLEVDTGDGQSLIELAGLGSQGWYQAGSMVYSDATKGAMPFGFWGSFRFPRFTIPKGTVYTAARIRQTARPLQTADPGVFKMRTGSSPLIVPYN